MINKAALSPAVPRPAHVPPERVIDWDIYSLPEGEEDFHVAWKSLQDAGTPEIVWTPRNGGHWMVTSGRLVSHVFADFKRFSSRVIFVPKAHGQHHQLPPSTIDPPAHRAWRNLLGALAPKGVALLDPAMRALASGLIEEFRLKGECNFTTEYAQRMPVDIFVDFIDMPREDGLKVKYWVDQTTRPDGSMSYEDAINALISYMAPVVEERRGGKGSDLITSMVNGLLDDRPLTNKEAAELAAQVLVGGTDTVVNMLGFIMHHLATNDANRRELVEHPERIDVAVEEFLRRFPIVSNAREVANDIEFEGVQMKRGEMVLMSTLMHGLDERENKCPMEVDFHRPTCHHSTFGNGPHKCVGAHLARVEIKVTLEEWLKRIPDFAVKPGTEISYTCGVVGTIDRLPLVWDPTTTNDGSGARA